MLNLTTGQLYLSAGTFTMGGDGSAVPTSIARFNRPRALAWDDRSDTLFFADCAFGAATAAAAQDHPAMAAAASQLPAVLSPSMSPPSVSLSLASLSPASLIQTATTACATTSPS